MDMFWRSILLLATGLCISACAQFPKRDTQTCDKLEPALQPYIEQGIFQGNLLLAKDGKVLCLRSVGFADESNKTPISNTSRFPIASLSKPIVATLLLKLQENGTLDLQTTLDKYLPEFKAPWANQVTLHHLLTNRSGVPNHFLLPGWGTGRYQQTLPKSELLNEVARMELAFTPGTQYLYSNLGWLLLGEVVESATGKGLEENLQEHIFAPLSMQHTGLVYQTQTRLVTGLRWGKKGGWQPQNDLHMQVFNAAGGIYSTAEDLLRYLSALHQEDMLTPQSKRLMFSADSPYGWRIDTLALANKVEKQVHSYDGKLQGHSSLAYQVLEDNVSLIVLSNTGIGPVHKETLADDILRAFYSLPYPDRKDAPSLKLNRGLLDNQWASALNKIKSQAIEDPHTKVLLIDLAQQLAWSGNRLKAIDLYTWLMNNFPENHELKISLDRLCSLHSDYNACQSTKKNKRVN